MYQMHHGNRLDLVRRRHDWTLIELDDICVLKFDLLLALLEVHTSAVKNCLPAIFTELLDVFEVRENLHLFDGFLRLAWVTNELVSPIFG